MQSGSEINSHGTASSSSSSATNVLEAPLVTWFLGEKNLRSQVEIILHMQSKRNSHLFWNFAAGISLLGSGKVVFCVLCYLLWFCDPNLGWHPSNAATFMLVFCGLFKAFLKGPRPYFVDDRVAKLDPTLEASYSFPSGHSTAIISIYGLIASYYFGDCILSWSCYAVICLMVAASRVYTGAHFISDVIGGLLLGAVLLWNELREASQTDRLPGSVTHASTLFALSIFTLCAIYSTSRNEKNMVNVKLAQEGISGAGFAFGLAVAHLLESKVSPSLGAFEGSNGLSFLGVCFGLFGIVIGNIVRSRVPDRNHETGVLGLVIVALSYAFIIIWALWLTPIVYQILLV